jgi:two-component system response regulator MprA
MGRMMVLTDCRRAVLTGAAVTGDGGAVDRERTRRPERARGPARAKGALAPPDRPRVLVVDDDEAVRAALAAALAADGYRAVLAADGFEALAVLADAEDPIGVVLLDLMMPNASGWRVLQGLPAERSARPAVIVVTALDPAYVRLPVASVDSIVRKPFEVEELLAVVRYHAGDATELPDRADE